VLKVVVAAQASIAPTDQLNHVAARKVRALPAAVQLPVIAS